MTMPRLKWVSVFSKLSKIVMFSFGIAVCLLVVASIGSVILSSGSLVFGPKEARTVFSVAFVASLVGLLGVELVRSVRDSSK